jgi:hypothetical protein
MTFSIYEKPRHISSTGGDKPTRTYHFGAKGSISEDYVRNQSALYTSPQISTTSGILYRSEISCNQAAYSMWDIDVQYSSVDNQSGTIDWDFDTTGGTIHITHSKQAIARYPTTTPAADGDAPPTYQAIGLNKDGKIDGTDIIIPVMRFNVTVTHPSGIVSPSFARMIQSVTAKVNSTPWMGWAAGEVLFLGGRGSAGLSTESRMSYAFAISKNATNITVGALTIASKKGHELVWIKYKDTEETVAAVTKPSVAPEFAYVERVYDTFDMAAVLGFG